MNEPEMVFESKTQSPEVMQKVLGADFDEMAVTVVTDQPGEEQPPVTEPPAAPPAEPSSSAPSPAPGPEAGAPPDGETPAPPSDGAQPPEGKKEKKSGSAKLKERLAHEQAENARLAAELEALKKGPPSPKPDAQPAAPAAAAPPAEEDPEPQEDQYETWAQYTKALTAWGVREARREEAKKDRLAQEQAESDRKTREAEETQRQSEAARTAEQQRWTDMVEDAKEEYPDYDDVMEATKDKIAAAPALVTAVRDHEDGARLAYYLCTHLDEEHRISEAVKLPQNATERQIRQAVIQASYELKQIASKLAAAPAAPTGASREARPPESGNRPPAATPAPAAAAPAPPKKPTPPTPVGSRGNGNVRKLEQLSADEVRTMDLDEFRKRRESGEGA